MKLHHAVAVWGERYLRFFLDVVLLNHITIGGLSACRSNPESRYRIYTFASNVPTILNSPTYARLCSIIPTEIFVADPAAEEALRRRSSYQVMTLFHRHAVRHAAEDGAYLTITPPDTLLSNDTFPIAERAAEAGVDGLLVCGLRARQDQMVEELRRRGLTKSRFPALPAAELVDLTLKHLHPLTQRTLWENPDFNAHHPHGLAWEAGSREDGTHGLIAHCWHLHPWLVRPIADTELFSRTIDSDYVALCAEAGLHFEIVADSNTLCMTELSSPEHDPFIGTPAAPFTHDAILAFEQENCEQIHLRCFDTPILFRGTRTSQGDIERACAAAKPVISGIVRYRADADALLAPAKPLVRLTDAIGLEGVYIYGTGGMGHWMLQQLKNRTTIHAFVDGHRTGELDGLPIFDISQFLQTRHRGAPLLICSQYEEDIRRALASAADIAVGETNWGTIYGCRSYYRRMEHSDLWRIGVHRWPLETTNP